MSPPDASGSSKANKSFPAGRSCRVLLALCPPTASTFPSPRTAETSAAQFPLSSALWRNAGKSPSQSLDFCACSAQRPAFAAAANSPAAPNLRALLRRAIPAAPPNAPAHPPPRCLPCFCIPPFACNFSLFTKPPPASYCLSGFFSIYSLAGKIITFNLFVRLT